MMTWKFDNVFCRGVGYSFVICLFLSGCSGPKPVLYPNDMFEKSGPEQIELDISACEELAEQHVEKSSKAGKVAGQTATGGAIGAATGAVGGAITGNVGLGAAVGAAAGATQGLLRGIFSSGGSDSSPTYRKFVNRCLKEKGYEPIGWARTPVIDTAKGEKSTIKNVCT